MNKSPNFKLICLFLVFSTNLLAMEKMSGDDFLREGEKAISDDGCIKSIRGVGKDEKEYAIECYENAANQYKIEKSWASAAHALNQAAELAITMKNNSYKATQCYEKAADCLEKINSTEASQQRQNCLSKAREIYLGTGKFNYAAKMSQKISEIYSQNGNINDAYNALISASDYYNLELNSKSSSAACLISAGKLAVNMDKFFEAAECFFKASTLYKGNNLMEFKISALNVDACICIALYDKVDARKKLNKYFINNSKEYIFIDNILRAFENYDSELLENTANNYFVKNAWQLTLIKKLVKKIDDEEQEI